MSTSGWSKPGPDLPSSAPTFPVDESLAPRGQLTVTAIAPDGAEKTFTARVRIDTPVELDYYRNGGILQTVLATVDVGNVTMLGRASSGSRVSSPSVAPPCRMI